MSAAPTGRRPDPLDGTWAQWQEVPRGFEWYLRVETMAETVTAKENVKRVCYVRFLNHPIYLDLIAQRPEIRLDKLENDSPDAVAQPVVSAAHAYQVSSARDELPLKYHATKDLLAPAAPPLARLPRGGGGP